MSSNGENIHYLQQYTILFLFIFLNLFCLFPTFSWRRWNRWYWVIRWSEEDYMPTLFLFILSNGWVFYRQRFCLLFFNLICKKTFVEYQNTFNNFYSHSKLGLNLDMIVTLWILVITKHVFWQIFHSWNVWEKLDLYFHRNLFQFMEIKRVFLL